MHSEKNILQDVKCIVNTCYYNVDGKSCNAGEIEIQPKNAKNSDDTDCSTFRSGQDLS